MAITSCFLIGGHLSPPSLKIYYKMVKKYQNHDCLQMFEDSAGTLRSFPQSVKKVTLYNTKILKIAWNKIPFMKEIWMPAIYCF